MPEASDETVTPMRGWFDRRDGSYWMLWFDRGDRDVLVFVAEEGERYSIEVDFEDGLEDRSDAELERLLDEARR